jgi:gliding motility-associated-like protein
MPIGTATTYTDNTTDPEIQVYKFIIRAEANDGGLGQAVSNEIILKKEPNIYYPTAFTPNDDNLNDAFVVFGQYVTKFEMKIFNRWGELLFTTNNLEQGWDVKYKGLTQPEGTYAFVAKITDFTGKTYDRSGSFILLKKK